MHSPRFFARFFVLSGVTLSIASCSLDGLHWANRNRVKNGAPLQDGVRYEVRKALAAGVPFRPENMKRYFFVYEQPRPPLLMAGMNPGQGGHMSVRTTAYCHDESDHLAYGVRSAVGTPLKFGSVRSAAADWSRYPVGTLFRIAGQPDVVYEVDDYGSALVGTGTIDLYKPSRGMMNDWGVRNVDIQVIRWGSYQRSMDIMKERARWPHVRQMMDGIQTQIYQAALTRPGRKGSVTAAL
jgi:3D (Asp-Asp-Asp) domain-containing protein